MASWQLCQTCVPRPEALGTSTVYFEKTAKEPVFKLLAIKKDDVEKIEAVDNSFIFKFK